MPATQRFRVISDAPAAVDSFSSHQPVADAIVALMDAERERGKAIGLSGSWGSGKSTIVELLRGKLSADAGTRVFQFDAWQHQGDPLRRAFLDSLIRFLGEAPPGAPAGAPAGAAAAAGGAGAGTGAWIDRAKWIDELDFVVGRKTRTESTVEKRVTFWGALVGILLIICLPLGVAIATKYDVRQADEWHTRKFLLIGISVFLTPFATAVFAWFRHRPHRRFWKPDFWTSPAGGGENSLLRLLIKEPHETTVTTSSKTLDPTSGEFRDTFVRMLNEALRDDTRRLVIVIDNLDRVDPEDAVAVWSTMRIFFEMESSHRVSWEARLWLIVPFDREALRRLWQSNSDANGEQSARLVDSFVNKTFQIVFNVAPPVVRRRMDYFSTLYDAGFPDEETRAYRSVVYGLYDRLGPDSPSPREIKLFLNKLGALYLQSAAEVPLPLVALYQLSASRIKPGARELNDDKFLEERTLSLLSNPEWRTNWRIYLAAVHFNVPRSEALHVLNGDRVAQALETGTPEDLEARIAEQGFWSICDRVIWERHAAWRQHPEYLIHAIEALRKSLDEVGGAQAERVMSELASVAEGVEEWPPLDGLSARAATMILAHLKGRRPDAYRSLTLRLLSAVRRPPSDTSRAGWYEGMAALFRYLDDNADLHVQTSGVLGNLRPGSWLELQLALFKIDAEPSFGTRFQYATEGNGFPPGALFNAIADPQLDAPRFVAVLRGAHSELPWAWLAERFESGIPADDVEEAAYHVRLLYALRWGTSAVDEMQVETAVFADRAMQAVSRQLWKPAAICLLPVYERALRGGEKAVPFLKLLEHAPLIDAFARALIDLDRLEVFASPVLNPDIEGFTLAVLSTIATIENAGAHMSPAVMPAIFPRARGALRSQLLSWSTRDDVLPFLTEPANCCAEHDLLFAAVLRTKNFARRDQMVAALIAGLKALPPASWVERMQRQEFEAVLRELVETAGATWIPVDVVRALQDMPLSEDKDYALD